MDSEISEMEKADSPLELCDFLYLELEILRKLTLEMKGLRSQSHFGELELETMDSEISEMEKAVSPLERSDSLYSKLKKLRELNLEMKDLLSYFEELELETMDSETSEMEKADSSLELCDFLYLELERLRKRNLEMKDRRSQSHFTDGLPWPSEANKLYLFFWHADISVMYSLYEIEVPKPLPPPQTKAAKDAEIRNPSCLRPILQFQSGMYPEGMCCVQLGSELYFLGGEFYVNDLDEKLKEVISGVLPRDVYIFYFTLYNEYSDLLLKLNGNLLLKTTPMNSGKASPQAFVADEKIYVLGSTFPDLDNESFAYFEVYDPKNAMWTILPNPPIGNTRWVGNAVVGRKAVLVALRLGEESLYCFDLDSRQWTNRVSIPDFPAGNFFSGKTEFVEDTLYGCYFNTIGAIAALVNNEEAPLANNEEASSVRLLNNHRLLLCMDAIFNVPMQLRSSSSLLHLGNRYFCYVRVSTSLLKPPLFHNDDGPMSLFIFQAPVYDENAIATRFFRPNIAYSKHYHFIFPNSMELFLNSKELCIKGCYALG